MCLKLKINNDKIMRITVLNLIVVTVLLLSGCAMKFPVPDETNQTILIIPVETRQTLGKFIFTLDYCLFKIKVKKINLIICFNFM